MPESAGTGQLPVKMTERIHKLPLQRVIWQPVNSSPKNDGGICALNAGKRPDCIDKDVQIFDMRGLGTDTKIEVAID